MWHLLLYLYLPLALSSLETNELDQNTINKLLKHVPEIPAIPTKNGYYIFVPSLSRSNFNNQNSITINSAEDIEEEEIKKLDIPQMRGVNRASFEYKCVQGHGIIEGPSDKASIQAMKKWNIEIVRLPLNEDCWLGINGVNSAFSGENYRAAVTDYVNLIRKNEMSVILDLHWSDGIDTGPNSKCDDYMAKCQKPMPDAENAPKFWKSVAKRFKDDPGVIFDLFSNPYPDKIIQDKKKAWRCWRDGGEACPEFPYDVAGMQDLVNAVRSTGATNAIMVGGIKGANDLSKWAEHAPHDKENKVIASWQSFKGNQCNNEQCWESEVAPLAKHHPLIVSAIGEPGCAHEYIDKLMKWLDERKISYLGWVWNVWDCSKGPSLISDYDGTPTGFGQGLYDRMTGEGAEPDSARD